MRGEGRKGEGGGQEEKRRERGEGGEWRREEGRRGEGEGGEMEGRGRQYALYDDTQYICMGGVFGLYQCYMYTGHKQPDCLYVHPSIKLLQFITN